MFLKYLVLFFLLLNLNADDNYSLRIAHGWLTESALPEILQGDIRIDPNDFKVTALDGGYLLYKNIYDLPIDIYAKAGLAYFEEGLIQDNIYEAVIYMKAYYNIDFLNNRARIGFGSGFSYINEVLITEYLETKRYKDNSSKYLIYLDVSVDFDIGKVLSSKVLYDTYIGWAVKHRSGAFGTINNVRKVGSNYHTIYLETNF